LNAPTPCVPGGVQSGLAFGRSLTRHASVANMLPSDKVTLAVDHATALTAQVDKAMPRSPAAGGSKQTSVCDHSRESRNCEAKCETTGDMCLS